MSESASLLRLTLLILLAAAAITYAPVFLGQIPFPAEILFEFPPFANAAPTGYPTSHTNIGDLVQSFYPFRTLTARALREGRLPLWNPYMLSGTPFLANAQSALFYPANWLYGVLTVPVAWAVGFFVRPLVAGLFTALFLRRIGGTSTGAIISSLLFAFCGFLMGWQGQSMSDAAVWIPFICYSVVRLRSEPSAKSSAITALAFAMPVLAGHPETAIHLILTGIALAAFLVIGEPSFKRRADLLFVKHFVTAGFIAFGVTAVQTIPTMEWLQYIHHSGIHGHHYRLGRRWRSFRGT